jgi:hypothetical protein
VDSQKIEEGFSGWNPGPTGFSGYQGLSGYQGSMGEGFLSGLREAREELERLDKKLSRPLCIDKHKKCGCEKLPKKPFLQRIWNAYVGIFRRLNCSSQKQNTGHSK